MNLMKAGRIVMGGDSDATERYIAPVVLVDVQDDDPVMQEEVIEVSKESQSCSRESHP